MASNSITLHEDEIQRLNQHWERLRQMPEEVTVVHVILNDSITAQFARWTENSWTTTLVRNNVNPFD